MTIQSGDIAIVESSVMSDAADGGGQATDRIIVDGLSNNIFPDISTLDQTYGRVKARKVYAGIRTQAADMFFGSHVILSKLPKNTKLGINLFATSSHDDMRSDAVNRIQNYRGKGGLYAGNLYGTQYAGSQTLSLFQDKDADIPKIGETFLLKITASGYEQYIRVVQVSSVVRSFTISNNNADAEIVRRIVDIQLSNPLEVDFIGADLSQYDAIKPPALMYKSVVANAARYYSTRPLKNAGLLGDYSVVVDSIYSQVIPASQSQTPLIDLPAGGKAAPIINAATGTTSFTLTTNLSSGVSLYVGRAFAPSSLSIAYSGGTVIDDAGQVKIAGVSVGVCDYAEGTVTFGSTAPTLSGTKTVTYKPAVSPLVVADTDSISITDLTRSFVYTNNLNPPPLPKALSVSFMTMGEWYELRDNGAGALVGQVAGIGVGSINYATGSVAITLTAMPDVGSELVFAWGKKTDFTSRAGATPVVSITKQLSHGAVDAASLVISWNDGTARSITCDAAGMLSGYGTGLLVSTTGLVTFTPTTLPASSATFSFAYNYGDAGQITKTLTVFNMTGNTVELDLGDTAIVAGSLAVEWAVPWGSSTNHVVLAPYYLGGLPVVPNGVSQQTDRDNAAGSFVGGRSASVNYATGIVSFDWHVELSLKFPIYHPKMPNGILSSLFAYYESFPAEIGTTAAFTVHYRLVTAPLSGSDTLTFTAPAVKLLDLQGETLVPGSLLFSFAGRTYVDRLGQLYYDVNRTTGAGTFGGTVDYATSQIILSGWQALSSNAITVIAALSTANFDPVDRVVFRTELAPLQPASFSIRATKVSGGFITATANENGVILTSDMDGTINITTGVVKIAFGQWVTAAGNEAQPWYNVDAIRADGKIFHQKPILASTIIYNAVSYSYIPLSPDILGLNPIRLPIDGRIPIYKAGDVVVILNDQTTTGTFTSSSTTDLGRVRLAKCSVKDLGGTLLVANKWTVDLDTGVITWGDLSGISQPLTILSRIEDMAVLSDVQITGKLTLSKPITHNYPEATTLVSNAVIFGDMVARASIPFDQQTWTNVWSDTLIGSSTSAQFNATLYPITVTNLGAIQERWLILFTNSTTFNLIGERVGQIVTGATIGSNLMPTNPANNDSYFTINHSGFGGGWSAGNVLRFDTYAAKSPVWIIQSIGQGEPTDPDYGFCVEFRGDIDAP